MSNFLLWSVQGGDFNTNYTCKVEIVLPELYAIKIDIEFPYWWLAGKAQVRYDTST